MKKYLLTLLAVVVIFTSCQSHSNKADVDKLIKENKIEQAYEILMSTLLEPGEKNKNEISIAKAKLERLSPKFINLGNKYKAKKEYTKAVASYQKAATIGGKYYSIAQNSINSLGPLFERQGDNYYSAKDYYSALRAYNNASSCFINNSYIDEKINDSIAKLGTIVEDKIPGRSKKPRGRRGRGKRQQKATPKPKKTLSKTEIAKIYKHNIVSIEREADSDNSHATGVILHTAGNVAYVLTTYNAINYKFDGSYPPYSEDKIYVRFTDDVKREAPIEIDLAKAKNSKTKFIKNFKEIGVSILTIKLPKNKKPSNLLLAIYRSDDEKAKISGKSKSDKSSEAEKVYTFTKPYSLNQNIEEGSVSETNTYPDKMWLEGLMKTSFEYEDGMQGTPLIDDQGRLIGIMSDKYGEDAYCIPSLTIVTPWDIVRGKPTKYNPDYLGIIISTNDVYKDIGGLKVDYVFSKSPAFSHIKEGDVITKITGLGKDKDIDFTKYSYVENNPRIIEVKRALYELNSKSVINVHVKGKGSPVRLTPAKQPEAKHFPLLNADFVYPTFGFYWGSKKKEGDYLKVKAIKENSWAREKGLRIGDKIIRMYRYLSKGSDSFETGRSVETYDDNIEKIMKHVEMSIQEDDDHVPYFRAKIKYVPAGKTLNDYIKLTYEEETLIMSNML